MTVSRQLPLRVLVKGPSTVVWTSMMGGPRTDLAFPRVMEQELLTGGRAVEVRNTGTLGWPTRDLFTTWDEDIVAWSPDIAILAVGHYESLHILLPRWIERRANTEIRRPGKFRLQHYKRLFFRVIARAFLYTQRWLDRPGIHLKGRMRRVIVDTRSYIDLVQKVGSPLILLMEIHAPSAAKRGWFKGWTERIERLNTDLRSLAADYDDSVVRFVDVADLVEQFEPERREQLWTDGIHFIPEFHRAVGVKFAGIAEEWAETQPHLAHP